MYELPTDPAKPSTLLLLGGCMLHVLFQAACIGQAHIHTIVTHTHNNAQQTSLNLLLYLCQPMQHVAQKGLGDTGPVGEEL